MRATHAACRTHRAVPSRRGGRGGAEEVTSEEAASFFTSPSSAGPHRPGIWDRSSDNLRGTSARNRQLSPLFLFSCSARRRLSSASARNDGSSAQTSPMKVWKRPGGDFLSSALLVLLTHGPCFLLLKDASHWFYTSSLTRSLS